MSSIEHSSEERAAVRNDLSAIFVSLELSRSKWLVTSLSPGGGEKMSKHQVRGGDVAGLLTRFSQLQAKSKALSDKLGLVSKTLSSVNLRSQVDATPPRRRND